MSDHYTTARCPQCRSVIYVESCCVAECHNCGYVEGGANHDHEPTPGDSRFIKGSWFSPCYECGELIPCDEPEEVEAPEQVFNRL